METFTQTQTSCISPDSEAILRSLLYKVEHGHQLTDEENEVWIKVKAILDE